MKKRNLNLQELKQIQFQKFSKFNIPNEILETIFEEARKNTEVEDEIKNNFSKKTEEYLLNELKKGNVDIEIKIIENYRPIKTITAQKFQNISTKDINKIYEQAIDYLKYRYNDKDSIGINIVNNIKYIITNNMLGKSLKEENIELFDMTFLYEYSKYNKSQTEDLIEVLNDNKERFEDLITGKKNATKDEIDTLCIMFSVDTYDELKQVVKDRLNKQKAVVLAKKAKKISETEAKYKLDFMKEYLLKNNVSTEEFAELLDVNIASIDKILSGSYKLSENKISILYMMYNVKNYDELKNKILNMKKEKEPKVNKEMIKTQNIENKKQVIEAQHEKDPKRDLSFFEEYIEKCNYSKNRLARLLNCGALALEKVLEGKIMVRDSLLWEVYSEFHVKKYEELKQAINERIKRAENPDKKIIIVTNIEEKKEEVKKPNEMDIIKNIDNKLLFNLLGVDINNKLNYTILILLFGGINGKYYSNEEVAKFLNVDKKYVDQVYKIAFEEIKRAILELSGDNVKSLLNKKEK